MTEPETSAIPANLNFDAPLVRGRFADRPEDSIVPNNDAPKRKSRFSDKPHEDEPDLNKK